MLVVLEYNLWENTGFVGHNSCGLKKPFLAFTSVTTPLKEHEPVRHSHNPQVKRMKREKRQEKKIIFIHHVQVYYLMGIGIPKISLTCGQYIYFSRVTMALICFIYGTEERWRNCEVGFLFHITILSLLTLNNSLTLFAKTT